MGRDAVAATVKNSARWQDLAIELKGLVQPEANVVILSYQANAQRDGQPYAALVSSGYVRRSRAWKLAFHQQTPCDAK